MTRPHGGALGVVLALLWAVPSARCAPLPARVPASPGSGSAAAGGSTERGGDDLLILDLELDHRPLIGGVTGYLRRGGVLLPLGELMRALDLAVDVDPGAGSASGWFLRESRRFSLNLERREAVVEGRNLPLDPEQVAVHPEDLYVDSSLLSRWFPLELEVDLSRLAVDIKPREKLPIEQRLERRAFWRQLRRGAGKAPVAFPAVAMPYRLLAWPTLDGTLSLGPVADPQGRSRTVLQHQALFTGDLLALSGELFVNSGGSRYDLSRPPRLELLLGRKDAEASLLGPLAAREFGFGTVTGPERPLIAASRPGQGFLLSSFPLDSLDEYDQITLRGPALPGWEVELYQNGTLLDFQTIDAEGRYTFTGVPLLFGVNLFRLIFYGPQGQRREEARRYVIGDGLIRHGESHYRLTASTPESSAISALTAPGQQEKFRSSFEFEHGFAHGIAAAAAVDHLTTREGQNTYGDFSLRASGSGAFARLDLAVRAAGGWATRMSVQTRFDEVSLLARYDRYQGFVSQQVPAAQDALQSTSELRLDGSVQQFLSRPVSYSLALDQQRRASGASAIQLSTRLAGGPPALLLANLLSLDLQTGGGGGARVAALKGSLLVNARSRSASLRGQLGYLLGSNAGLSDVALTYEWDFGRERRLRCGLHRTVVPPASEQFLLGGSWRFADVLLGANLTYEAGRRGGLSIEGGGSLGGPRSHGLAVGLTLSYSVRRAPASGEWQMSSRPAAMEGAAEARVFLDHDLDGRFGPGDEPLAGVRFATDGATLHGETGREGTVLLSGLPLYRPSAVAVNVGSLEDPLWIPAQEGFRFTARPGTVPVLEFPVVTSGEIEGTVVLRDSQGEKTTRVADVHLELVEEGGAVVREAKSEYDGFYLFERVPPGRYRIRVEGIQARRLGFTPPPERAVVIGPQGETVRGIDFQLAATGSGRR